MPKKKTAKRKSATKKKVKPESPYRKYIDEIEAVVRELNPNWDWWKHMPFAPTDLPDADGMARLREHAFLILRLKRIDEDREAKGLAG